MRWEMTSVNDPFEVHRVVLPAVLPPYQPRLCKHLVPTNGTLRLKFVRGLPFDLLPRFKAR